MKVSKQVLVEQKTDELGQALVSLAAVIKAQVDAKVSLVEALPSVVTEALKDVTLAMADVASLPAEEKEDPVCFVKTLGLVGADLASALGVGGSSAPAAPVASS